jgi:hypothetical protein
VPSPSWRAATTHLLLIVVKQLIIDIIPKCFSVCFIRLWLWLLLHLALIYLVVIAVRAQYVIELRFHVRIRIHVRLLHGEEQNAAAMS